MSEFLFDEERHVYTLDSKILPGVTTIIDDALQTYAGVPRELLERAAAFGHAMHKTVQLYEENDLYEDSLDEPLQGCLSAFKTFKADHRDIFKETPVIERPGYHKRLHYAGTPDFDFPSTVIDLKSRKCNPLTDALQLCLYDHMTGNGKRKHFVLELYQDGSYVLVPLNQTVRKRNESWSRARYLLDFYNMKSEIERWK